MTEEEETFLLQKKHMEKALRLPKTKKIIGSDKEDDIDEGN